MLFVFVAMYVAVCIRSYLKSVLRNKFLIFVIIIQTTLYLCEQICDDPWLFFGATRGPRAKRSGNTGLYIKSIKCILLHSVHSP
jgi:hypothetical protein